MHIRMLFYAHAWYWYRSTHQKLHRSSRWHIKNQLAYNVLRLKTPFTCTQICSIPVIKTSHKTKMKMWEISVPVQFSWNQGFLGSKCWKWSSEVSFSPQPHISLPAQKAKFSTQKQKRGGFVISAISSLRCRSYLLECQISGCRSRMSMFRMHTKELLIFRPTKILKYLHLSLNMSKSFTSYTWIMVHFQRNKTEHDATIHPSNVFPWFAHRSCQLRRLLISLPKARPTTSKCRVATVTSRMAVTWYGSRIFNRIPSNYIELAAKKTWLS